MKKSKKAIITVDANVGGKSTIKIEFEGIKIWSKAEIRAVNSMMIKEQRILRNGVRREETKKLEVIAAQEEKGRKKEEQRKYKEMANAMFEKPHSNKKVETLLNPKAEISLVTT